MHKPDSAVQTGADGAPPWPQQPHVPQAAGSEDKKEKVVAISSLVTDAKAAPAGAQQPPPAPGAKSDSAEVAEKASFGELYHFATGFDKICVAISCVMMAGTGITLTMSMIILGNVLDGLNDPSKLLPATRLAALNFLIVGLVAGTAAAIGNGLPILAAERQMKRAREAYFAAVLRQDSGWFDTVKSGEMAANLAENSITWKTGIAEKFPQIFQGLATLCAGLGLGFHYSWQLTLLVLSIAPAVAILGGIIAFASGSLEKLATDALGEAGACAMEVLNSIRIVVAYGGQRQETQRYSNLVENVKQAYMRKGWWVAAGLGAFFMCMFSAYAYTMYVGGVLIRRDRVKAYCLPPDGPTDDCLTGGRVVQTFFVVITALFSLGQTVPGLVALASAQVAAAKMLKVIRRVPVIDSSSPDGLKTPIEGRIEFRDVTFAYPSRLDVPILSNFNLVIEKGQSVAFVGPSGSGKSTIVALVLRMYDPQSGCILIDGKDIKEYNVIHLRSALGLVSQDPQLFSLSVSQNIALGKQDQKATQEEIVAAARAANADAFVSALPDRYNTIVGTSVTSSQLSGGQRQRICIARCLIRKPSVMLFDEATSALDTESEVAVQSSIDSLLSSSLRPTSLIIAHRLSTVVNSNVICVIDQGRIAQCGSHAQLMGDRQGLYHHLQSLQQLNVAADPAASPLSASAPPSPSLAPTAVDSGAVKPPVRRISDESSTDSARRASNETAAETAITVGNVSSKDHASVPESRVWAMQKTEMNAIIAALAFSLINGGANTVVGLILAKAIAAFYLTDADMESELIKTVGYFMAVAVGMFFANTFGKGFFCLAGEALSARLRAMTFSHILRMEMGFFDEDGHSAGSLETRLSADAGLVKGATGEALSQVVSSAGGLAVGVIVAMQASWRIGLIILGTVPCTVLGGYYMTKAFMGTNKADKEALEKSGHIASEAATAIRTVSSLNLQSWMLGKFSLDTEDRFVAAKAGAWRYSASSWFGFFNMQAVNALAWYVGGIFIDQGVLTFGELMQAFFAMQFAAMTIQQAFTFGPEKAKAVVAIESIFNILDRPSLIDPSTASGASPALCSGRIEFQNVTFSYPSRPDRRVLDGFCCVIEAGQSVALVGQSGCGKSSIIALLLRFYDPQSGVILLDGNDISSLNLNWLRSHFGYVQQEPALFDNTIEYNIHYGHPEPTKAAASNGEVSADVMLAARQANALEFIETMPKKFGTECGARGSQLSGGQKQRIAIARMLLRGAPIILLDEATSALDSESELVVQKVDSILFALHFSKLDMSPGSG